MNVFVAKWEHKFGEDIRVFKTDTSANKWRQAIAEEWWEEEMPTSHVKPAELETAAEQYFDYMSEHDREFFNIDEVELEE